MYTHSSLAVLCKLENGLFDYLQGTGSGLNRTGPLQCIMPAAATTSGFFLVHRKRSRVQ